jgi:hypothetical protein
MDPREDDQHDAGASTGDDAAPGPPQPGESDEPVPPSPVDAGDVVDLTEPRASEEAEPTDTDTEADVDAEADAEADVDAEADADADVDALPADDAVAATVDEVASDVEDEPGDEEAPNDQDEWDDEDWEWEEVGLLSTWRARILLGVGALGVVALLAAGVLVVSGSDDDDEVAGGLDGVPTDTFNRRTTFDGVGVASNGDSWSSVNGKWGIDAGQAFMQEGNFDGSRNLVVLDMGSPNGEIAVLFARVRQGAGLVFRYTSPDDLWMLIPVPDYGTWAVQRRVDGELVFNENIGLAHSDDGTRAVLRLDGPEAEVQIDDLEPVTIDIGESSATGVGFTAEGPDTNQARFDDLYAIPA